MRSRMNARRSSPGRSTGSPSSSPLWPHGAPRRGSRRRQCGAGFVDRKRPNLATLKSLGATGGFVFALSLAEVLALAFVGSLVGLAVGSAAPFLLIAAFGHLLPLPLTPRSIWANCRAASPTVCSRRSPSPPGRSARPMTFRSSALFRDLVDPGRRWPRRPIWHSRRLPLRRSWRWPSPSPWDRRIALLYVASAAGAFLLLQAVGRIIMAVARRLPRPRGTEARLALGNIHRPGALTPAVTLSLGLA